MAEKEKKGKAPCGQCGKPANLRCSRCKGVLYCNPDCQRAHWATHKQNCKPAAQTPKPAPPKEENDRTEIEGTDSNSGNNATANDSSRSPLLSNAILRDLFFKAGQGSPFSDNSLPPLTTLIEELRQNEVMTLQRYIDSLRDSSDGSPFSGLGLAGQPGPEQVFVAITNNEKELESLVELLKSPKLSYTMFKIVEFLLLLLKTPNTPASIQEGLLRLNFFSVCLDLFFEQGSDILRSELLQFFSELVAEKTDINVLLEQGQLVERTIAAVEKSGEQASSFLLSLADLLLRSTDDERITNKLAENQEAWGRVVQPQVERWREQKIWTPETQVTMQSYGSDRFF